jgi:hypothetical protein
VENPPPPPPKAAKLSQCDFPNEKKPWRVDNTCKAILDDVAKNLQQNPDSKLVIVGNAEPTEKRKNLAGERAADSKFYLTEGEAQQRIDPSRIEVRTGSGGTKTAEYWIVPSGATFDSTGSSQAGSQEKGGQESAVIARCERAGRRKRPALFRVAFSNLLRRAAGCQANCRI